MDAACLPALARLGLIVLPPGLRDRAERLGELPEDQAAVTRAEVEAMAALMVPR